MRNEPLSYWVAVARMGFEEDLHRLFEELGISQAELARRVPVSEAYASKFLNGTAGNYELGTMAKWARAVEGVLQVRITKNGEVLRAVDYDTARALDEKAMARSSSVTGSDQKVVSLDLFKQERFQRLVAGATLAAKATTEASHG